MVNKAWRIIPRPLLETILNNHAHHHRVPQPLILHGPRGVGKTTLILERLMETWNTGPHITGYVDLAESIEFHHPKHGHSFPWASWSLCPPPSLPNLTTQLDLCLESMAQQGIKLGTISSQQIFATLSKWHNLNTSLKLILQSNSATSSKRAAVSDKLTTSALWDRAVYALSARQNAKEIDEILGLGERGKSVSVDEVSYYRESVAALRLAKEVIKVQQGWRVNAVKHLNQTGGFSRSLANSATDWPCLLLELLSAASEIDYFQPKLVINNIDVLKNADLADGSTVCASIYHDSLIWRIIALGANERCLPVILVTSDSYYSYRAYMDFGFPDIFISRETFGWSPQEAKMHMVTDYFSHAEWNVIVEVLGPNPRHLFELYALKQSNYYQKIMDDRSSSFEDIVDAYLAYLQVTVVNPAMDKAVLLLQKFAIDARSGRISQDRLRFGAPWRHPPPMNDPTLLLEWAKLQLLDFVQSLVSAEFGVNYLADCSLEILDDPSAVALIEVGLLYSQRDPSFIRPVSRGIQRCLACPEKDANELSEFAPIPVATYYKRPELSSFDVTSRLQIDVETFARSLFKEMWDRICKVDLQKINTIIFVYSKLRLAHSHSNKIKQNATSIYICVCVFPSPAMCYNLVAFSHFQSTLGLSWRRVQTTSSHNFEESHLNFLMCCAPIVLHDDREMNRGNIKLGSHSKIL